jgi:ElaB/YqjD/DUF883 family membrane-anchored ribosome-binding protein
MSERDDARRKYHLACLAELAEMAMDIARVVAKEAQAHPERAEALTRVVDRLTRDVQKTNALHRKIAAEVAAARVAALATEGYVAPPTSRLLH